MKDPIEFAAQRFAAFAEQVLEPAVFACTAPLNTTAAEFTRAPAFAEAIGAAYQPIEVSWRTRAWGNHATERKIGHFDASRSMSPPEPVLVLFELEGPSCGR